MNFFNRKLLFFFSPLCEFSRSVVLLHRILLRVGASLFSRGARLQSHSERQATRDLTALAGHQAVANILQQGRQNNKSLSCKFGSSFRCKTNLFK